MMNNQEQFEQAHADWIGDKGKHHTEQVAFLDGWKAHANVVNQEQEELIEAIERLLPHLDNLAMSYDKADEDEQFARDIVEKIKGSKNE